VAVVLTVADWLGMSGAQALTTTHVAFWCSATFATYYDPESAGYDHDAAATFITVLAIGQAVGCSAQQLVQAQRIAGMFGLDPNQAAVGQVTDWKHCTFASCAVRGLLAVRYARAGFEAPPDIYQGNAGVDRFFRHADTPFEPAPDLDRIIFKRWPALVFCQTPIDVALDLAPKVTDPSAVTDVEVRTYAVAARNGATPEAMHPDSRAGRTHSIPYCVATALLKPIAYEDFDQSRSTDPALQAVMARVRVVVDPDLDAGYPAGAPCTITLTFADGTTATASRRQPVGDSADPLTDAQLEQKLRDQFLFAADDGEVDRVLDALHHLERTSPTPARCLPRCAAATYEFPNRAPRPADHPSRVRHQLRPDVVLIRTLSRAPSKARAT
jgi:2-methylcitrate dehydratase